MGGEGPACLPGQKKEVMTESHTTFKNSALIVTHKHIDPPGGGGENLNSQREPNIYVNNEFFLRWLKSCDIKQVISLLGVNTGK